MSSTDLNSQVIAALQKPRSKGDNYEAIAFTLCKAATLVLFFQLVAGARFVLPAVALATAVLYLLALAYGRSSTRCVLRYPSVIVTFWMLVAVGSLWLTFSGRAFPSLVP